MITEAINIFNVDVSLPNTQTIKLDIEAERIELKI